MPAARGGGEKEKEKKTGRTKKEKKPIQVVAVVTPDGIEGTFTPEPRKPLIVHLPFQSIDVEFPSGGEIRYDPNPPPQPEPYDSEDQLYFQVNTDISSSADQIGVEQEGWKFSMEAVKTPAADKKTEPVVKVAPAPVAPAVAVEIPHIKVNETSKLLLCYATKPGETLKVPMTTEISCFWCAQTPRGPPCFLPVKEESGVFHVYGNFCTPQCGLAHLLAEHLDSHVRWERMALLHRMYKTSGRLYPAPPRESLSTFGGPYSYDQFLDIIQQQHVRVDIQLPPLVSILGTLDTKPIDFYDSSLQNTFTGGFSLDRFKAWSEQGGALRLKRSKPLKDRESTLDSIISIRKPGDVSVSF